MISNTGQESPATDRLSRLLESVNGSEGGWSQDELCQVWQHQLASALGSDLDESETGTTEITATQINTFKDLFWHPSPPVEFLRLVKGFAKQHLDHPHSPLPKEIATGLYYLSIVTALIRTDHLISRLDDDTLKQGFKWGLQQPWLDEDTKELLQVGLVRLAAKSDK